MRCACAPSVCDGGTQAHLRCNGLKNRDVFQERQDADDHHDHPNDLFRATVDRQQVDEVKHQNNDNERNQRTDQKTYDLAPLSLEQYVLIERA